MNYIEMLAEADRRRLTSWEKKLSKKLDRDAPPPRDWKTIRPRAADRPRPRHDDRCR